VIVMAGAQKLSSVILVDKIIRECSRCHNHVAPRKLEVLYHNQSGPSSSKYFLSDIWHCRECGLGHMLQVFKATTDTNGKKWIVSQQTLGSQLASRQTTKPGVASTLASSPKKEKQPIPTVIRQLNKVLPDHISQCKSCSSMLIKHPVELIMRTTDLRSSRQLPIQGLYCPACRIWMLHETTYLMIQNQNKPYRIDVEVQTNSKSAGNQTPSQSTHIVKKERYQASAETATAKQPSATSHIAYNQYGVFVPGKNLRNRRGYFNE
jgi:hypothetical protein